MVERDVRELILIGCVKSKLERPAAAKELYTSRLFRGARCWAERRGSRWMILSALHGLVGPEDTIAPYEATLLTMGQAERRKWGARVMAQLDLAGKGVETIIFLAGAAYRTPIESAIEAAGTKTWAPLKGLGLGRQLQWFAKQGC